MDKFKVKAWKRRRRHLRARRRIAGTAARPRLAVHRTLNHIYVQLIDDDAARTLVSVSTRSAEAKTIEHTGNCAASQVVGKLVGEKAVAAGYKKVVFDRGGCLYHGRVKMLAEAARKAGLEF